MQATLLQWKVGTVVFASGSLKAIYIKTINLYIYCIVPSDPGPVGALEAYFSLL